MEIEKKFQAIWRDPAEETDDIWPDLVVHDDRVTGSITFGPTRLPLWAPNLDFVDYEDYIPDPGSEHFDSYQAYRTQAKLFLYNLLEARGEFARLLLVLARAERNEAVAEEAYFAEHSVEEADGIFYISPDAPPRPSPWWENPELKSSCNTITEELLSNFGGNQ